MQSAAGVGAIQVALSLYEAPGQGAPLVLRLGQRLVAEVLSLDAQTGRAMLSMAGRRFTAQADTPLAQGQVLRVVVADASPENLVLRLAPDSPLGTPSPASPPPSGGASTTLDAAAVLAQLELPVSAELRAAVMALVDRGRPLTRPSLLAVRSAIAGQPALAESARAAVTLQELGLPLTQRALELARAALTETPPLPLGDLLQDLAAAGWPEAAALAVEEPTAAELQRVVTLLAESPENALAATMAETGSATTTPLATSDAAPSGNAGFPQPQPASGDAAQSLPASIPETTDATDGVAANVAASAPGMESDYPALPRTAAGTPTDVEAWTAPAVPSNRGRAEGGGAPVPSAVGDTVWDGEASAAGRAVATLPADARTVLARAAAAPDLPAAVRALARVLHDRIELQQLGNAAALARASRQPDLAGSAQMPQRTAGGTVPSASLSAPSAGGVPNNAAPDLAAAVPNALPDLATAAALPAGVPLAFSIPLAMGGQYSTVELSVQRDAGGRSGATGRSSAVRASFTVTLARLGQVRADLRLDGPALRCRLSALPGAAHAALSEALPALRDALAATGFRVESLDCLEAAPELEAATTASQASHLLRHVDLDV